MTEKYIGLCMMAGGVVIGGDSVLDGVRRGRVRFVLISSDASDRTKKQLTDKCTFYKVRFYISDCTGEGIAHMLGRSAPCAAIGLNGRGPWKQLIDSLTEQNTPLINTEETRNDRKDD